jgi:FKBP-type peptidyl-prolyl cis-trans isomerase SlyD
MTVEKGKQVSIEYTLRVGEGGVVDSNAGKDPLTYIQGDRQIVPGLEEALEGMAIGENKEVTVPPEKGFGERSEDGLQIVEKSQIPEEAHKVDVQLQGHDDEGNIVNLRVAEVTEETVVLDLNHPLAGKPLHFHVKILDITEPSAGQRPG